jgi:hypothetical protein
MQKPTVTNQAPLNGLMFWVVFATATITFSNWLATFKAFTVWPVWSTFFPLALATLILVFSVGLLVYDGYVKELLTGSIRRRIRLFDWIYHRHD